MISSRRNKYCVFGCANLGAYMHRFPHPETRSELFSTWVSITRDRLSYLEPLRVYKNKRICNFHFRPEDKVACHRLVRTAVPCLHLNGVFSSPGLVVQLEHNYSITPPNPPMDVSVGETPGPALSNEVLHRLKPDTESRPSTSKVHAVADLRSQSAEAIHKKIKRTEKENRKLKNRLRKSTLKEKAFKTRLADAEKTIASSRAFNTITKNMTPAGRIFTGIQYREALKKSKGRRYNFEEKVLALSLYKKSPKCYAMLARYFTLPSAKALRNLLSKIKLTAGTNKLIFEKIKETVATMKEDDKLCTLMFDEMSVSPSIHYHEASDELKGFASEGRDFKIATHALVFMIKGIKSNYKQPVAYYFTENLNKNELKKIIIEVIRNVQATGLKVIATVCDQGASNVAAVKSLIEDTKCKYFRQGLELRREVFEVDGHKIVPLFDVPHLIKGLRNNLITKDLMYTDFEDGAKKKLIKWEYFQLLYEADKSYKELRFLPKLTEEHVNPAKIKKMKVKMAAQIFSRSVAAAARHMVALGDVPQECTQIIPFVLMVDQLFDSLNAGTFYAINGKEYRAGVKKNSPHHKLWETSIKMLKTVKYVQKKIEGTSTRLVETVAPSVVNLIKTIEGMKALWITLNQQYSVDVMITRNFNQDPVENFFGNIRSLGVRNISPDCRTFEAAFKTLLLNNYSSPQALNSNCEEDYNNCLQSYDFFIKEQSKVNSGNHLENQGTIHISEKMQETLFNVSVDDPCKHQQRQYVCGWVLTKCLKKIVKSCASCRSTIISNNTADNDFIRAKEYHVNKQWLCYPSNSLNNSFNEVQDLTTTFLKTSLQKSNLKQNILMLVDSFVGFPFDCDVHREQLKKYFCNLTVNILIYSWCRSINRILVGKITYNEGSDDPVKQKAQIYYNKHKHKK